MGKFPNIRRRKKALAARRLAGARLRRTGEAAMTEKPPSPNDQEPPYEPQLYISWRKEPPPEASSPAEVQRAATAAWKPVRAREQTPPEESKQPVDQTINIREWRETLPPLDIGERFLLWTGIGGSYWHPMEGRHRTAISWAKTLRFLAWIWAAVAFLFVGLPIVQALSPFIKLIEETWWLIALLAAPPAFVFWLLRPPRE